LGWCLGTKPAYLRQPRLISSVPRPTGGPRPGDGTAVGCKAGAAGVPSKRRAAGATAKDIPGRTGGPLTSVCHRCGWPPGLPLGLGSPAAPWLRASRSG
jgi:hypothetical protein